MIEQCIRLIKGRVENTEKEKEKTDLTAGSVAPGRENVLKQIYRWTNCSPREKAVLTWGFPGFVFSSAFSCFSFPQSAANVSVAHVIIFIMFAQGKILLKIVNLETEYPAWIILGVSSVVFQQSCDL